MHLVSIVTANDEIDNSQIEGFVLNEPCLAIIGETMFSTEATNSTNLLPEDIPRPALESEDSEAQDVWLSCRTPSGMIFDIDGADHEWMVEVLQKKKLESGDTFLIAPDKCRVGAVDQKLLVPKSALKFAKAPKSAKSDSEKVESTKSSKSDRRKLRKGSSKTSRRGMGRNNERDVANGIERVSRRLLHEERSVLIVRVVLSDAEPSNTVQELSDSVFGNNVDSINLATQFHACSYGQMSFVKAMHRSGLTSSIDNGTTTVTIPYSKTSHHGLKRNKIAQELNYQFGVGNPRELADHVMYCLPPGSMPAVAYGIINSHLTVFLDRWCTYVSAQMHEIGHNLEWGHNGTLGSKYNDMSGIMGYSFAQSDGPKLCTNGAKFWKTHWYGKRYHIINDVTLDQELRSFNYTGALTSFNNDPLVAGPPMIIKVATDTNMTYFVGYNDMTESNSGATSLDTVNVYSVEDEEMYGSSSILHATLSAGETFHASIGISLDVTVLSIDDAAGEAMIDVSSSTTVFTRGSFEVLVEGTCNVTGVEGSLLSSLIETDPESSFEVMSAQPHCVSRRNLQEESTAAQNSVLVTLSFSHKYKFGPDKRLRGKREVVDKYKENKRDIDAKLKGKFNSSETY